jgi:hypothetical protein
MYYFMYIISFMLILNAVISYRPVSTDELSLDCIYSKIFYTDDEKVNKLNALWSMYPTDHKSLIFMHSFDGVTNTCNFGDWKGYCDDKSSWPWCPAGSVLWSNWKVNILGYNVPFPPISLPIEGISFSAFNKYIIPEEGKVLYNQDNASGILFKCNDDKLISPMCYYPSDGATITRSNGGCGNMGIQLEKILPNNYGYKMNGSRNDVNGKEIYKSELFTRLSCKRFLLAFSQQKSLNFKQFIDISKMNSKERLPDEVFFKSWRNVDSFNEVIFKSWRNVDFLRVPLFAFFHSENAPIEIKKEIHEIAKLFEKNVKKRLPVVSFDPENLSEPFKLSNMYSH